MANTNVPSWMGKATIIALITTLIGGAVAWATSTNSAVAETKTVTAVQGESLKSIRVDVARVEQSQRRIEDKLDKALQGDK